MKELLFQKMERMEIERRMVFVGNVMLNQLLINEEINEEEEMRMRVETTNLRMLFPMFQILMNVLDN